MMLWLAFSNPEKWSVFRKMVFEEIQLIGINSIVIVGVMSVFMGGVMSLQVASNMDSPLLPEYTIGYITRSTTILEFSPTVISLILAGKAGSNIASEVGTMRTTEQIDALEVKEGMLIALKRFTYTAEREAKDFGIAALKKNHPVFNIFSHYLVPEHEIMNKVEVDQMLEKYNAKLLQLPRIYEDDPGIVAVNGKVGDVIRIIRENGENFRLVVPRPEGGRTENTALVKMTDQRLQRLGNVKDNTENIEN